MQVRLYHHVCRICLGLNRYENNSLRNEEYVI